MEGFRVSSLQTDAPIALDEAVEEARSLVLRYQQADKTSVKYVLHWKSPNGSTGHGQPATVDEFRAVLNDASFGPDANHVNHDGIVHWLVPVEEVD